ncbi:MAG: hypothetical protein KIS72_10035 [Luteimonas sp.]|nr:hypothetical protein [Luteimonas sp.]
MPAMRAGLYVLAMLALSPAFARDSVTMVVYQAPKMFFSSPGQAPILGGPGIGIGPDRPSFGSDPGERFAQALSTALRDRAEIVVHLPDHAVPGPKTTRHIENPVGTTSLIVFTTMNFLGYRPMRWATYQYGYGAYLRIADAEGRTVLETHCLVKANKSREDFQLKRDELQVPGRFDAVVDRVVEACAAEVADGIAAAL